MSFTEKNNLSTEQIAEIISEYVDNKQPIKLFATALYAKQHLQSEQIWKFVTGKISTDAVDIKTFKYPEYAFVTRELEVNSYEQLLKLLTSDGVNVDQHYPKLSKIDGHHWTEGLVPSSISNAEWPVRKIETKTSDNVQIFNEKLIGFGWPVFEDAGQMLQALTDIPEYYIGNSGDISTLLIEIKDQRGRLLLKDDILTVDSNCEVGVVGYIIKNNKKHIYVENNKPISTSIKDAEEYEIFLVTKKHEVIDYMSSKDNFHPDSSTKAEDKYRSEIEQAIDSDEGETVEFKTYIDLCKKNNKKVIDLEKVVCSFSNHKGGKLILGVNNGSDVIGLSTQFGKQYHNDVNQYVIDIKKRLEETLSIKNCF